MTSRDKIEIYAAVIAASGTVKTKADVDKVLDRADMYIDEIERRMNPDNEPQNNQ